MTILQRSSIRFAAQTGSADCGLACFSMIASHHGIDLPLARLRATRPASSRGMTLSALMSLMHEFGFAGRALRCELESLAQVAVPAILHWRFNHFVVLEKVGRKGMKIHDPASGSKWISFEEASPQFTGVLVEVSPPVAFNESSGSHKQSLFWSWGKLSGLPTTIGQMILLTLVVQIFVLSSPLLFQITIDNVVAANNPELLWPVVLVFLALTIFYALGLLLRGLIVAGTGSSFAFQASINVANRLFRLPIHYFVHRDTGDLLSRLSSVVPIRDLLVSQTAQALLDGLLALFVLILLFLYSPFLALVSLIGLVLYASLSLLSVPLLRRQQERMVIEKAREQQTVIESIRGIATVRMFGKEADRLNVWQNLLARAVSAELRHAQLKTAINAGLVTILAVENILSIAIAATLALDGRLTIGALVAYFAYKAYLFTKAGEAFRYISELKILRLHVERLRDIIDESDNVQLSPARTDQVLRGAIELQDVWFRHSADDPWIFECVNLRVEAGDHVAIEGPSGSGKSTLMLLLLGLLRPSRGRILVDGLEFDDFGMAQYRRQAIGILQADQLFSGSIRDNISFFDPEVDFLRVQQCALAAAVHEEITAMPMRYDTMIGEAGSSISGGQKQRLILARALYQQPKVLVMDEGTAHLDLATEGRVNDSIAVLGVTRIVFAHRIETIERAEKRYRIENRGLNYVSAPEQRVA